MKDHAARKNSGGEKGKVLERLPAFVADQFEKLSCGWKFCFAYQNENNVKRDQKRQIVNQIYQCFWNRLEGK